MRYYIDLFSPETARAFSNSDQNISGFRVSRKSYVENQKITSGDRFICYCTKIQRFIGVLEVLGNYFIDDSPIFNESNDPFVLRFKVKVIVWLPLEYSIPIHEKIFWNHLSFTKELQIDSTNWTFMVFSSPRLWPQKDCEYIEKVLIQHAKQNKEYPFSEKDLKKLKSIKLPLNENQEVIISIPENGEETYVKPSKIDQRDSIKIQAKLCKIGETLGFKIWIPVSDRKRVLSIWKPDNGILINKLPLVFDETTLKTIKNIDVLWLKRRSIVRCFEVEDTTSIYSGILRMADLLSLQPMLDIKIHIVAPVERRDSVFQQISRPVFAFMEKGPLATICSYISYDSIKDLSKEKKLQYMNDSIIDEYTEYAD